MSYNVDLGRVKGNDGTSYIPKIIIKEGKQYIKYQSNDNSPLPESLQQEQLFNSQYYEPHISNDGQITFTLKSNANTELTFPSLKGEPGRNLINIKVVNNLPSVVGLNDDDKNIIYILKGNNNTLQAAIYDDSTQDFIVLNLNSMIEFNDYYTKNEVYNKNDTYSRDEIDTLLGNINTTIDDINDILLNSNDDGV